MISTKAHLRRRILCRVQYYAGQCYGQSCAQLSPALWLRRVRPLLRRTVLCHGFVRSYGYGPILWVCPVLWLRRTTSSFTMVLWYDVTRSYVVTEVRRPVLRLYGSVVCLVLSYVWIYGMCGPILRLELWYVWFILRRQALWYVWHVWSYPTSGCPVLSYVVPAYDPNLCVALSYVAQACDPTVCAVLFYAAPGRRRPSTYFAQSHQTSAYVRVCGPHMTILGPRSAAWRPGGQRSRQGAPTLPCLIVQLGQVEG
jgi:hypothetical protein